MGRMKNVPTYEDDFQYAGPTHLMSRAINWSNDEDRRCITACLVKATWVIENDKEREKRYLAKMAKPWHESFGFKLKEEFQTGAEKKYAHGTVFELMTRPKPRDAPQYVVAFRGTMLYHPNAYRDLIHDLKVLFNTLTSCARFEYAHWSIDRLIDIAGDRDIWLAGHSLGASLALEIGRNMMLQNGRNIPTFLFNPPHVSPAPAISSILKGKHKTRFYTGSYAVKYALANIMPWNRKRSKKVFEKLDSWCPNMYVNPHDLICRGHIDYFEQRELVAENHPRFASTAMRTSYRDIFFSSTLRPHLLPTARLWINSTEKADPHGLKHWWKPDYDLKLQRKFFSI
ncbi:unnamed protein product [Alopecurus aequalis]